MTFAEWYQQLPQVVRSKMCRTSAEFAWVPGRLQGLREAEEIARETENEQVRWHGVNMQAQAFQVARRYQQGHHVAKLIADAIAGRAGC